jgi:hypothetical protein
MPENINIALCLSGGGFRATLFHFGVMKRLHELRLLDHVRLLSAVSGGAITAALFNCNTSYSENDRPELYDWQSFEAQLLQATSAGILGSYFKSLGVWLSLGIGFLCVFGLFTLGLSWLFLLASIMAFLIAAILYKGILPQSREYARQTEDSAKEIRGLVETAETFLSSRLSPRLRALLLPLSPSIMRRTKLDALFDHEPMSSLRRPPLLCLGAVELNRGQYMVFSNLVLAVLGRVGTRALWEQRAKSESDSGGSSYIEWLPVAEVVAASSAFPPFFRPVTIRRRNGSLVGVFTDGGVVDNLALLAPIDMMIHLSEFEEEISDIFIVNAGAPASETRLRWPWPTLRVLRRVVIDIMQGHQEADAIQKLWLIKRQTGPKIRAMALEGSGFLLEGGRPDYDIPRYLARIRTHFDAFDPVETATLVYSGYSQADLAFGDKAEARIGRRSFHDVSREVTGAETVGNMSKDEIVRHLCSSHLRWVVVRRIWRAVAKVADRLRTRFRQRTATGV